MEMHPKSFKDLQSNHLKLDLTHVAWLKQAKKSKTAFAVADS